MSSCEKLRYWSLWLHQYVLLRKIVYNATIKTKKKCLILVANSLRDHPKWWPAQMITVRINSFWNTEIIHGLKIEFYFAFLSWPVVMDLKTWCYEIRIAFSFDLRSVGRSLRDVRRRRRRGRGRKRGEKKSFQRSTSNLSFLWKKLWERRLRFFFTDFW